MTLRLDRLPDRTPVRMSLSVDPDLASALSDYAEIYLCNIVEYLNRLGLDLTGNVLDVGCTLGMISDAFHHILSEGSTIHGVDLAPAVVAKAREHHPGCRVEV